MSRQRKRLKDKLPEAFKACQDGWKIDENTHKEVDLKSEEEFQDAFYSDSLAEEYRHIAAAMEERLSLLNCAKTSVNAYTKVLLSDAVLRPLIIPTNKVLKERGYAMTDEQEIRKMILHKNLLSRFNVSPELAFKEILPAVANKHSFELMDVSRFRQLVQGIRAYHVEGRSAVAVDDDTWFQQNALLRRLNDFEVITFKTVVEMFLNKKNGILVVDDELVGSRANDVERKTLSYRKTGREGPVADCVADSILGVMFGARLRVRNESEEFNVKELLKTIPMLTANSHGLRLCFDRGYGKIGFVSLVCSLGFNLSTIANSVGSRHPFITSDELKKQDFERKWSQHPCPPQDEIIEAKQSFEPFVLKDTEYLGPKVSVAVKDFVTEGGTTKLMATAVRDVFNKKEATKDLRFFSTGPVEERLPRVWIFIKKTMTLPSNTLFSNEFETEEKNAAEFRLLQHCQPITQCQRTADWFNQKAFRLTGTMASVVVNKDTGADDDSDSNESIGDNEVKVILLNKCLKSWFGKHVSTEAMRTGSANEVPTAARLAARPFIKEFYEVGLLELKEAPFVGVSPDGVAKLSFDPTEFDDDEDDELLSLAGGEETDYACVEIKTRSSLNAINRAESAARLHGSLVHCVYGDATFNACVPSQNRQQVLHQAFVTGLDYGVFVTSKVQEGEGSLIQIVIVKITSQHKEPHSRALLQGVGRELLGWLVTPDTLARGHLVTSDFPTWMKEEQIEVLKSHFPLWCAQYKRIRGAGGNYAASYPVGQYKHSQQYNYCHSKWGLDKNTECCNLIAFTSTVLSFQTKYIYRLVDSLTFAHWRYEQAKTIILPWLANREQNNLTTTTTQIRRKAKEKTIQDHVYELTTASLRAIELEERMGSEVERMRAENAERNAMTTLIRAQDQRILDAVKAYSQTEGNNFPPKRNRALVFAKEPLSNLRRRNSAGITHAKLERDSGQNPKCALCLTRRTITYCSTCKVSLCDKAASARRPESRCFNIWHRSNNLVADHNTAKTAAGWIPPAERSRSRERASGGSENTSQSPHGSLRSPRSRERESAGSQNSTATASRSSRRSRRSPRQSPRRSSRGSRPSSQSQN